MRTSLHLACDPPEAMLRLSGELDLATGDQLRDALASIERQACTHVELDVGAVTFIDASSLRLLVREHRRLARIGGGMTVMSASETYQVVTRLAGYDEIRADEGACSRVPRLWLVPALDGSRREA